MTSAPEGLAGSSPQADSAGKRRMPIRKATLARVRDRREGAFDIMSGLTTAGAANATSS
jgi:hypothetical protein